jgi:hypothetical protein
MPLIGLTGENGAGKTILANVLTMQYRLRYVRLGFADPIRAAVAAALGETVDRAFSHPVKDSPHPRAPNGATPRALAICWGEAARATFGTQCWVAVLAARAALCGPRVVVDDLQFRSEMDWIHENRGFIVSLGTPPEEIPLREIALIVPRCPTGDAGPEAKQIWLTETMQQILKLARSFPPPPWWNKKDET